MANVVAFLQSVAAQQQHQDQNQQQQQENQQQQNQQQQQQLNQPSNPPTQPSQPNHTSLSDEQKLIEKIKEEKHIGMFSAVSCLYFQTASFQLNLILLNLEIDIVGFLYLRLFEEEHLRSLTWLTFKFSLRF